MDLIAYALRDEYVGTVEQETDEGVVTVPIFTGGIVRAGERDIDVREELEAGGGLIVLDVRDAGATVHLDEYPALKRVTVPEGAKPSGSFAELEAYADRKLPELRGDAHTRGIGGNGNKAALIVALEEHDRRLAEGSLDELGAPITVDKLVAAAEERDEVDTAGAEPSSSASDAPPAPSTAGESGDPGNDDQAGETGEEA